MRTKRLAISSIPLATFMHRKYYDIGATLYVMQALAREKVVDGFEFELLAEWNAGWEPVDRDTRFDRRFEWENSRKYEIPQLAEIITRSKLPVFSVHANRDIGVLLCSGQPDLVRRGRVLMERALSLASAIGAETCVFHLWDAWTEDVDFAGLRRIIEDEIAAFPDVRPAVENIPIYSSGVTPFTVVQDFPWITLDLKWATMYHEFERFQGICQKITNIHFHGSLVDRQWVLKAMPVDYPAVYREVTEQWHCGDLITLEAEEDYADARWAELVCGISSVRSTGG